MQMSHKLLATLSLAAVAACGGGKKAATTPPADATPAEAGATSPGEAAKPVDEKPTPPAPPPPPPVTTLVDGGLSTPESVLYDAVNDVYLVTNINGGPGAKDSNGFISRISPDGTVLALKWIDGATKATPLDAPKGMAISGGLLYVADIDKVRTFELATGKAKAAILLPGATFANDVAAGPDGAIYVSDSGVAIDERGITPTKTDAVWVIRKGKASALARGEELGRPNGLFVTEAGVWVNTFGSGELYLLDGKGARTAVQKVAGALDGLYVEGDVAWSTSWEQSAIVRSQRDGATAKVRGDLPGPADFAFDSKRGVFVVPLFNDNKLVTYPKQ